MPAFAQVTVQKTGAWKSWKAPGADARVYAVYVDETDKVWAAEWSAQVMLRFDPASEKFESFKSASSRPTFRPFPLTSA